jgi:hypothetical protein
MTRVAGSATNRAGEEGGLGGGGECRGGEEREGRKWKEGECCEERQVRGEISEAQSTPRSGLRRVLVASIPVVQKHL